jgi:predicted PhzF superfamily epimerase YddE/YHI9
MSSASRRVLQVSARAFVSPPSSSGGGAAARGGNPVTIFVPSSSIIGHHHDHPSSSLTPLTPEFRARLAQTCQWESVIIEPSIVYDQSSAEVVPKFSFYLPSGEEVSFCAHAAIGACSFLANKAYIINSGTENERSTQQQQQEQSYNGDREENDLVITFIAAQEEHKKYHANVRGSEAELVMDCEHYESKCNPPKNSNSSTLSDFLKEIGLHENDIDSDAISTTFINSSVARPKTLIPLKSAHRVHAASPPQNATKFQEMCESIGSTGLYLYDSSASVAKNDGVIECRQFPKFSGYAEDPATGIAAGALVASLYRQQLKINMNGTQAIDDKVTRGGNITTIFQGTAMARPSQIKVKIDKYDDIVTMSSSTVNNDTSYCGNVRISYAGLVAFDSVSYVE